MIAFVKEQTWSENLAVLNTVTMEYISMQVCNGSITHAEFRCETHSGTLLLHHTPAGECWCLGKAWATLGSMG